MGKGLRLNAQIPCGFAVAVWLCDAAPRGYSTGFSAELMAQMLLSARAIQLQRPVHSLPILH